MYFFQFEAAPQICPDFSGQPLGFDNCNSAFFVLIFGLGVGLILFLTEACSKITGLNFYCCDAYDRTDDNPEEDKNAVSDLREMKVKDKIIQELASKVMELQRKIDKYEQAGYILPNEARRHTKPKSSGNYKDGSWLERFLYR